MCVIDMSIHFRNRSSASTFLRVVAVVLIAAAMLIFGSRILPGISIGHDDGAAFQPAVIERVVDGDTIDVITSFGAFRVRLKGVNCPESVHPDTSRNTEAGVSASDFTKSLLPAGTPVWLESDPNGDDADKYGRFLRYVWLSDPSALDRTAPATVSESMVQGRLLESGHAEIYSYSGERFAYFDIFEHIVRPERT